jgi:hypothetical protein
MANGSSNKPTATACKGLRLLNAVPQG